MTLFLIAAGTALTVSFVCSLLEATLLSLTPAQVADLSKRQPSLGKIWQGFKSRIEQPIAVILIMNTAAHTIGASVAGSEFDDVFGDRWIWVFSLVFTYLMLQFTEILPKSLGVRFNMEVARWIARPLSLGIMVLYPVTRLIHWVNRPFEFRRRGQPARATLEEITALAGLARLSNQIGPTQERIIVSAARLREMRVRQVMLPLDQIVFLSTGQDISEALVAAHIDAHTRYPVCEGQDRDRVVGYVNFKELVYFMRTNPNDPSFQGIIRPVRFANPDQSAADLLRTFINEHVHIAIVRDAQDKTLGLVTMEDLVEELLGELEDEFDRLPRMFDALSGGTWMVGGGTPISEVAKRLELDVADQQGTISAWLERRLGRKPAVGDEYQEAGSRFSVRRLRRGQAFEIVISRIAPGRGSESAEHAGRGGASP